MNLEEGNQMNLEFKKPSYCKYNGHTWCEGYSLNPKYKGKYYRKECSYCWANSLRPKRVSKKEITVRMNTTHHICPVCNERIKKEYSVDLGFRGRHVLVHINCLSKFIDNLIEFKDKKLPSYITKIVAKTL